MAKIKIKKTAEQKKKEFILKRDKRLTDISFQQSAELSKIGLPKQGEQIRLVTEKSYNAYSFVLNVLEKHGEIDEFNLAIYRINEWTAKNIIELIDKGLINNPMFIISDFFRGNKKPERFAKILSMYCNEKNIPFDYLNNHAKVILIKAKYNYFVFEGSGNLSDNARIEQYLIENNKEIFDFHKNWMKDYIKKKV